MNSPNEEKTACQDCRHLVAGRSTIWYDLHCGKHENEKDFNPYSGTMEYPSGQKYKYVRDINSGHCKDFKSGRLADRLKAMMISRVRT